VGDYGPREAQITEKVSFYQGRSIRVLHARTCPSGQLNKPRFIQIHDIMSCNLRLAKSKFHPVIHDGGISFERISLRSALRKNVKFFNMSRFIFGPGAERKYRYVHYMLRHIFLAISQCVVSRQYYRLLWRVTNHFDWSSKRHSLDLALRRLVASGKSSCRYSP